MLERFYRVAGTLEEGNGLGLAISDEISRVHGAQLSLVPAGFRKGVAWDLRVRLTLDASS